MHYFDTVRVLLGITAGSCRPTDQRGQMGLLDPPVNRVHERVVPQHYAAEGATSRLVSIHLPTHGVRYYRNWGSLSFLPSRAVETIPDVIGPDPQISSPCPVITPVLDGMLLSVARGLIGLCDIWTCCMIARSTYSQSLPLKGVPLFIPVAQSMCSLPMMEIRLVSPLSLAFAAAAYIVWRLFRIFLRHHTSSLQYLRGPKPRSWLLGNLAEIYDSQEWVEQYGDTLRFGGILNVRHISQCYFCPPLMSSLCRQTPC